MHLDELSERLIAVYGFARPADCYLLRSYTNAVYGVDLPNRRFVFKVYGNAWRSKSEIQYEMALLQHIAGKGLAVAAPIRARGGDLVLDLVLDGRRRHGALFPFAAGEKPQPPFGPNLYRAFGRAIAQVHALSDEFTCSYSRQPLEVAYLIDEPLRRVLPLLDATSDRNFVERLAEQVKSRIGDLAAQGLDWGPIHGDASLDNLHVTADGSVILYDFDGGGPGWRAADLQGWAFGDAAFKAEREAFLNGYSEARPINDVDLAAAPYLTVAGDFWGMRIDLDRRVSRQGRESVDAYLRDWLATLHQRRLALD